MKLKKYNYVMMIAIVLGILLNSSLTICGQDQLTVDEIIDRVKENQVDAENSKSQAEMILIDEDGEQESREIIMFDNISLNRYYL